MKVPSDISLILGRLRPSKRLTSTHVLSQCAAMCGGIVQPINFSKPIWAEALPVFHCRIVWYLVVSFKTTEEFIDYWSVM